MFEIVQAITVHEDRSYEYTVKCQTKWLMRSRTDLTVQPKALLMFGLGRFAVTKQRRARDARSVSV